LPLSAVRIHAVALPAKVTCSRRKRAWLLRIARPRCSYGLALNASALPTDKTYANKRKAAEILNKVWTEQPNHPGVVHYLIHSGTAPRGGRHPPSPGKGPPLDC
jgi:hypothetical protein